MFVSEEIAGKKKLLREVMVQLDLDAIMIKRISNFAWLTGGSRNYVGVTSEIGQCPIILTRDGDYLVSNTIEAPRLRDEELLEEQGYRMETYAWHNDAGESEAVARIVGKGRLGSDCGYPGSVDVNSRVTPLRYSLTKWEIERYEELGRITSTAIEDVIRTARPGDKECAITGRLVGRLWEDRIDNINNFCAADDRIGRFRHPIPTERTVDKHLMLCVNSRKYGLIISITRHIYFGSIPAELRRIYDANVHIDCLMMVNSVPGRPYVDPFLKGIQAYKDLGFDGEYELHHQGGSIGYAGRDHRVSWSTKGNICMNQGFSWNPSITGSKSEDVMIATDRGVKLITYPVNFPEMRIDMEGQTLVRPDILEA